MTTARAEADPNESRELLPVTVVTGFLGAGKTTLVNEWLARIPRGDVAVIVNELGSVGIDGELLAARVRVLYEVTGGCICCTTQAELVAALDAITRAEPQPKRVLIETSGAASPAGVLRAITRGGRSGVLTLDGVVTVVDTTRLDLCFSEELALEQLGFADVIVLSRADLSERPALDAAKEEVLVRNSAAVVVEAAQGRVTAPAVLSLDEVLALRRAAPFVPRLSLPATASHVYESLSFTHDGEVDGERFADFMEERVAEAAGRIFRIKGVLAVEGVERRLIVQGVGDSAEVVLGDFWGDAPRHSRLVVVGFGLDGETLRGAFTDCLLGASRRLR